MAVRLQNAQTIDAATPNNVRANAIMTGTFLSWPVKEVAGRGPALPGNFTPAQLAPFLAAPVVAVGTTPPFPPVTLQTLRRFTCNSRQCYI